MIYLVFIIALTLVCAAAVGFSYLLFLEGVVRQHKRRIAELERECDALARRLSETEMLLSSEPQELEETEDEWWPEVVDEDDYPAR